MVDRELILVAFVFLYRMICYRQVSLVSTHSSFILVNSVIMHLVGYEYNITMMLGN